MASIIIISQARYLLHSKQIHRHTKHTKNQNKTYTHSNDKTDKPKSNQTIFICSSQFFIIFRLIFFCFCCCFRINPFDWSHFRKWCAQFEHSAVYHILFSFVLIKSPSDNKTYSNGRALQLKLRNSFLPNENCPQQTELSQNWRFLHKWTFSVG